MTDEVNWRNIAYRQVIINFINNEISQSFIKIHSSAREIELCVFIRHRELISYLRKISQIILRIRGVNKRIVLFKGEKFQDQKEDELMNYLRKLIQDAIHEDITNNTL